MQGAEYAFALGPKLDSPDAVNLLSSCLASNVLCSPTWSGRDHLQELLPSMSKSGGRCVPFVWSGVTHFLHNMLQQLFVQLAM